MSSYLQTELKFQGMSGCNPIIYEVFFIFESWKMRNCDVWLVGVYIFLTQGLILRQVNADWLLIIKKKKKNADWLIYLCVPSSVFTHSQVFGSQRQLRNALVFLCWPTLVGRGGGAGPCEGFNSDCSGWTVWMSPDCSTFPVFVCLPSTNFRNVQVLRGLSSQITCLYPFFVVMDSTERRVYNSWFNSKREEISWQHVENNTNVDMRS